VAEALTATASTTAAAWLSVALPHFPQALLPPQSRETCLALARHFPATCLMVLETHLGGRAGVDLSFRCETPLEARGAAELPELSPPARQLFQLFQLWAGADGALSPVHSLWTELDLSRHPGPVIPEPVLCARFETPPETGWLLDSLLPLLHGMALTPPQRQRTAACLGEICPPAHLLYAFSLAARGQGAVRLEIFGLDGEGMVRYLSRMDEEALASEAQGVEPLFSGADRTHLSFDIDPEGEILPRLGIEYAMARLPEREPRWRELFERLIDRGFCSTEEAEAALTWPGYDTFRTAPDLWPVETAGIRGFCVRALSHLKLVCRPGRRPGAKVYRIVQYLPGGLAANTQASSTLSNLPESFDDVERHR